MSNHRVCYIHERVHRLKPQGPIKPTKDVHPGDSVGASPITQVTHNLYNPSKNTPPVSSSNQIRRICIIANFSTPDIWIKILEVLQLRAAWDSQKTKEKSTRLSQDADKILLRLPPLLAREKTPLQGKERL